VSGESPAERPRSPVMAVILSGVVCPGAGQMYNRERGKGLALIAASVVACTVLTVVVVRNVLRALPADVLTVDVVRLHAIVQEARSGWPVALCTAVLTLAWIVSVVDAYLVARRSAPAPAPDSNISR
jgi:riboflavin transporter FmnP